MGWGGEAGGGRSEEPFCLGPGGAAVRATAYPGWFASVVTVSPNTSWTSERMGRPVHKRGKRQTM